MPEKNSMPLSVLLAICTEINSYKPAQVAAARVWVDIDPTFRDMLLDVCDRIPSPGAKQWIENELHGISEPE